MTNEQILEIIERYKLRIPPTVYYDLKADIVNCSEIPTGPNDLAIDCISRTRAIERLKLNFPTSQGADNSRDRHRYMQAMADIQAIRELPSVTPQEPQTFKWCTDCREYDQEKHCCHRWSKVIRDTVEEMKQEPKTGHWKPFDLTFGRSIYYCTVCDVITNIPTSTGEPLYKYCPNCGAKMESEVDNGNDD